MWLGNQSSLDDALLKEKEIALLKEKEIAVVGCKVSG